MKRATWMFLLLGSAIVSAQSTDVFRARITGSNAGSQGKCTVEVVVDATAEVQIRADEGRIRTIAGAPATWRRFDCNMRMPSNPADFAFAPQTGRGRQALLQEPSGNRGTAIVRIEDPSSGREGYKFDLEWNNSGYSNNRSNRQRTDSEINSADRSIFDSPTSGDPVQSSTPRRANNALAWNGRVNFQGTGEGYYRAGRSNQMTLNSASVTVNRNGKVQVTLSGQRNRLALEGRLLSADNTRLVADMSGGTIHGTMQIELDDNNNVQELAMTGTGNNRFDLRWTAPQ